MAHIDCIFIQLEVQFFGLFNVVLPPFKVYVFDYCFSIARSKVCLYFLVNVTSFLEETLILFKFSFFNCNDYSFKLVRMILPLDEKCPSLCKISELFDHEPQIREPELNVSVMI